MHAMELAFRVSELFISITTLATLVWGLIKMFKNAHEAKIARTSAEAAAKAAKLAAEVAASHAAETTAKVVAMAEDVHKIEKASNSMKDALVAATAHAAGLAGEIRGREEEARRRDEESQP